MKERGPKRINVANQLHQNYDETPNVTKLNSKFIHLYIIKFSKPNEILMQLRKQLQQTRTEFNKLKDSFENNLNVIEEQDEVINQLEREIDRIRNQKEDEIDECIRKVEQTWQEKFQAEQNRFKLELSKRQDKVAEIITAKMAGKFDHRQLQLKNKHKNETEMLKNQITQLQVKNSQLQLQSKSHFQNLTELKQNLLDKDQQITLLTQQKVNFSNKLHLHQQQLESIRSSNNQWQDLIKSKLKQVQKQKQTLEDQICEYKLKVKERMKSLKEENLRKISQVIQQKDNVIRNISQKEKQNIFKLERLEVDNMDYNRQVQTMKNNIFKLEKELQKTKDNRIAENYKTNQKQHDYMVKLLEQDRQHHTSQLENLNFEKKQLKQEFDQCNLKREENQKAVARLKVQLQNIMKENQLLKKESKKIHYEKQREKNEKEVIHFDKVEPPKQQVDYSKVFTEDIGYVDDKFFEFSAAKSPKNQFNPSLISRSNPQLMKRMAEIQHENNNYKKNLREISQEIDLLRIKFEQDKMNEERKYLRQLDQIREKSHAKQNEIYQLKQKNAELKFQLERLKFHNNSQNDSKQQLINVRQQIKTKNQRISQLQKQVEDLTQKLSDIENDKQILEDISSELRAQNNELKEAFSEFEKIDHFNQQRIMETNSKISIENHNYRQPQEIPTQSELQLKRDRPKTAQKLHNLVKQRKMLAISGKRAPIQQRLTQVRLDHLGTESQKQVLEKIKLKAKTPPKLSRQTEKKGVNYLELKDHHKNEF